MRLAQIGSDFECGHCSSFALRERVLRGQIAIPSQQHVAIGDAGVCESVARIFLDRLLEVADRFVETFFRPSVPVMAALEVQPVSFGVFGVALDKPLFFGARKLQTQFFGYLVRNFILDHEDVAGLTIELRPP